MSFAITNRKPGHSTTNANKLKFSIPEWVDHGKIPSLDGLRGIAILLVLLAHSHSTAGFPITNQNLKHVFGYGTVGVDLFFAISGFLITTLMLRETKQNSSLNLKGFYIRRSLRILPAYFVYLATLVILQRTGAIALTAWDWISAITYTVNFNPTRPWEIGHLWSLSIEEHFYFLWPLLFVVFGPKSAMRSCVVTIGSVWALRFCLVWAPWVISTDLDPSGKWTFMRIDVIAWGCLLACALNSTHWCERLKHLAENRYAPWGLMVLAVIAVTLPDVSWRVGLTLGICIKSVCLTGGVCFVLFTQSRVVHLILENAALKRIGVVSYSLYLWQQLFLHPDSTFILCIFPLNLVCAFTTAFISYHLIESPFLRLKQRYSTT